jgi:hypothetical protein
VPCALPVAPLAVPRLLSTPLRLTDAVPTANKVLLCTTTTTPTHTLMVAQDIKPLRQMFPSPLRTPKVEPLATRPLLAVPMSLSTRTLKVPLDTRHTNVGEAPSPWLYISKMTLIDLRVYLFLHLCWTYLLNVEVPISTRSTATVLVFRLGQLLRSVCLRLAV